MMDVVDAHESQIVALIAAKQGHRARSMRELNPARLITFHVSLSTRFYPNQSPKSLSVIY